MKTVVGVFPSEQETTSVAHDLEMLAISSDEIVIADDTDAGRRGRCLKGPESERSMAAAGASGFGWLIAGLIPLVEKQSSGGAVVLGGLLGGGAGLAVGLIVLAVSPGTPIIAGSGVATTLAALAIGAAGGGLVAGLYNKGVSHARVPLCEESFREHGMVVAAEVDERTESEALRVMSEHGARKLRAGADAWVASGSAASTPGGEEPHPSDSSARSDETGQVREVARKSAGKESGLPTDLCGRRNDPACGFPVDV